MTDMQRFTGKVAVVTGAAGGFGEAIARRFADEGASVVVADVDESGAERVANAIRDAGGEALAARTDVSLAEDVERMIAAAVDKYGGLDVLVSNVGAMAIGPDREAWLKNLQMDIFGLLSMLLTHFGNSIVY